jgi:hypothetical protein
MKYEPYAYNPRKRDPCKCCPVCKGRYGPISKCFGGGRFMVPELPETGAKFIAISFYPAFWFFVYMAVTGKFH